MTDDPEEPAHHEDGEHDEGHHGDDRAGGHGSIVPRAHDYEAEKKERLEAIKRAWERDGPYMRELADRDCSPPDTNPEEPAEVGYAESALATIIEADNGTSADGRAKIAYYMVLMLAKDNDVSTQQFSTYVSRLQQEAPDAFAACARRLLTGGAYFLATGTNVMHDVLLRLSEVIRLHLATDLGLQRAADLLKLEVAIEALAQARLLTQRATCVGDGLGAMTEAEEALRRKAMASYKLFSRTMDELQVVAERMSRARLQATLADRASPRATVTDLAPSAAGSRSDGWQKAPAAEKA